nr:hypothetical protein [Ilumatobacter sp.]
MALRWFEGFDVSVDDVALARIYTGSETFLDVNIQQEDPAEARGGVSGASFDKCGSQDEALLHTPDLVASAENSWIFGFAFRSDDPTNIAGSEAPGMRMHNSDGEQLRIEAVEIDPASTKPLGLYYGWRIMRGATEIARTDQKFNRAIVSASMWVYFEFKVTIHNTLGSVEGRYKHIKGNMNNGGAFTTFTWDNSVTNIDTQEQTSAGVDSFVISFDTGTLNDTVSFDNIYICDSTGSKNNDYLGKCVVTMAKITTTGGGDGDTTDWTLATATSTEDAWQEPVSSVEDDDRLTSDTIGQIHLAEMDSVTTGSWEFFDD